MFWLLLGMVPVFEMRHERGWGEEKKREEKSRVGWEGEGKVGEAVGAPPSSRERKRERVGEGRRGRG